MKILMDENEWLLSEDMIGQIKEIIYKRDLLNTIRETNEIPNIVKFNYIWSFICLSILR